MNNPMAFMNALQQFRAGMGNQNPDALIDQMMRSGRISQAQYNQARQMAEQFQKMMNPGAQGKS